MTKDDEKGMDDYLKVLDKYYSDWDSNKKDPHNKMPANPSKETKMAMNSMLGPVGVEAMPEPPGFEFGMKDVDNVADMAPFIKGMNCRFCGGAMTLFSETNSTVTMRCHTMGCRNNPDPVQYAPVMPAEVKEAMTKVMKQKDRRNPYIALLQWIAGLFLIIWFTFFLLNIIKV